LSLKKIALFFINALEFSGYTKSINNNEILKTLLTLMDETDLDLVDIVNVIIPGEKHLPGMRYCGPGTRLDLRLNEDDTPKPGNEPIDRVDKAALKHDLAYSRHSDLRHRHAADKEMIHDLLTIEEPTCRERCERCVVIPIMFLKRVIGSLILRFMDFIMRRS